VAVGRRPLLLVLRALGLGDLLTAVPALRGLRAAFPEHRLVLAAPRALAPLALLTGAVDEVADTRPLQRLRASLYGADVAVGLHGKGPESHRVLLAAQARRLIAFANEDVPETRGMPAWRADEHEVDRWCRLLAEAGISACPSDLALDPSLLRAPPEAHGATLVHPGAASAARRWPAERFAAVARAERRRGRRVLVTGAPEEAALARSLAEAAGLDDAAVLAGRTDLVQLAGLVSAAGRVVCGDTGVGHLATALGTPSVVLFGPTSPALWGPPPGRARHRVLWAGTTGDPHASEPDPGLLRIRVDDVLAALRELDRFEVAA
jgi:ADP-heptose:LPS heptosyltransferase